MRRVISGGVTAPLGFKANGIYSGIKKSRKKDLMLLVSDTPCKAVGVFTTNKVKASCVDFNLKQLKDNRAQAIIANSGNANCLTGPVGRTHTQQMAASASRAARVPRKDVLVASTGVILAVCSPCCLSRVSSCLRSTGETSSASTSCWDRT